MTVLIKRANLPAAKSDGARVLIDRLWPRGQSKEKLHLTVWLRDIAPSTELRKWFGHDPAKWEEFRKRYRAELDANPDAVAELRGIVGGHATTTLVFMAHDEQHCNAVVLKEYLGAPTPRKRAKA
ncbi:MAG: DUF488 family protein [Xanthomonadales bacterium]|nr:DUF488 family protein [Xanthomonadales bacterium]ODU92323.1 MAG: hypothetical protein ABT18_12335 [Rhodanobacter sp. SCN 66-43]OJY85863.1 MAG: hypothetical protein BGP23_04105 [Xanthomonadales bacterium 66-474]